MSDEVIENQQFDHQRAPARGVRAGQIFARGCQVCKHPDRWRIELLKAGGASLVSLADKFGVHKNAVDRHWHRHVSAEMKASYLLGPVQLQELAAKAAEQGGSVLDHLHAVRTVLMGQLAVCAEASDSRGCAYVAGRLTSVLEVIAKISGELGDLARNVNITNNVNVLTQHPDFIRAQATIVQALGPFPEATRAVIAALDALESKAPQRASKAVPALLEHAHHG
ncbi:hypothetical protein [Bradyrhizobium sp. Tv2a-2]|uniref:hypothetical protein n=1 Tax=Bradyrhizobium sp. Tv2a-2 TaxID=113395 RepID=UPI000467622B|nr:hypothetical protein [Bradyrhizobium sp. Tv2a-2]